MIVAAIVIVWVLCAVQMLCIMRLSKDLRDLYEWAVKAENQQKELAAFLGTAIGRLNNHCGLQPVEKHSWN